MNGARQIWPLLLAAALLLPTVTARSNGLPPPQPLPATGNCYDDNIFYGAVPPGGEHAPVLVFVHGLAGMAEDWWIETASAGLNDSYLLAYQAGYRTAFVNLNIFPYSDLDCNPRRRPAKNMIDNGYVLRQQLNRIVDYYDVAYVDIVAHSKGGIDAQVALVWWGGAPLVRSVFTLGTPHQGSLLADLLWSPEGAWVGILLGQRDAATYSMRVASMELFRRTIDPAGEDDHVRYYVAAGNFWQTPDSLYQSTGAWLQSQPEGGDNDGIVVVTSTRLLNAEQLFLKPWNHTELSLGRNAFPYIDALLRAAQPTPSPTPTLEPTPDSRLLLPLLLQSDPVTLGQSSGMILRGGQASEGATRFALEPEVRGATITLISNDPTLRARLVDPGGMSFSFAPTRVNEMNEFFAGAAYHSHTFSAPRPGWWELQFDGPATAGYLLLVSLDSSLQVDLKGLDGAAASRGAPLSLQAAAGSPRGPAQITTLVVRDSSAAGQTSVAGPVLTCRPADRSDGISVSVHGTTADGMPFERSFIRSFATLPVLDRTVPVLPFYSPGK